MSNILLKKLHFRKESSWPVVHFKIKKEFLTMAKKKKNTVTLYAAINNGQYDGLRTIAFSQKKSLANVVREAVNLYLKAELPMALKT
jgi:hypothetical protein